MTPRPLFFDLDHTLWDFETNSRLALRAGHAELHLAQHGVEDVDAWIASYEKANDWCWGQFREGKMDKATLRSKRFHMAFEGLGLDVEETLAAKLGEHYISVSPYQTALIDGTLDVLDTLLARGHRMVVLTNGFEEVQHIKVQHSGLERYFTEVLTSDALGVKKPHPEAFSTAASMAGLAMDAGIVMIGDSLESDVLGAQNVGWDAVHFNPDGPEAPEAWRTVRSLRGLLDLPLGL